MIDENLKFVIANWDKISEVFFTKDLELTQVRQSLLQEVLLETPDDKLAQLYQILTRQILNLSLQSAIMAQQPIGERVH